MENKKLLLVLLAGGALWYFTQNRPSENQKKDALLKWVTAGGDSAESKNRFL